MARRAAPNTRARGATRYATPRGTNNSVRGNRISAKATPKKSKPAVSYTARSGNYNATSVITINTQKTGSKITGVRSGGNSRTTVYSQGQNRFKAPNTMPTKLNNTASAAVAARRWGVGTAVASPTLLVSGLGAGISKTIGGRQNNFASTRLKASGYRVAGTGFGGKIKPISGKAQAKAKARLARKEAKSAAKGYSSSSVGLTRLNKANRPTTKAKSPKGGKGGSGRGRRTRRDSRGRYAGSY